MENILLLFSALLGISVTLNVVLIMWSSILFDIIKNKKSKNKTKNKNANS